MTVSAAANVSPVHGGLAAPVHRLTSAGDASRWRDLPKIDVVEVDRTTLYRIADGTLSPLEGPMGETDYRSVLERAAIGTAALVPAATRELPYPAPRPAYSVLSKEKYRRITGESPRPWQEAVDDFLHSMFGKGEP